MDWGANEFSEVMDAQKDVTFADWSAHQFWRYQVVRPLLVLISVVALPVWLYRVTNQWIGANAERLRLRPRIFRLWALAAVSWLIALWFFQLIVETFIRFYNPSAMLIVPIVLTIALMWLRSFIHPRVAPFDKRYHSQ